MASTKQRQALIMHTDCKEKDWNCRSAFETSIFKMLFLMEHLIYITRETMSEGLFYCSKIPLALIITSIHCHDIFPELYTGLI